MYEYSGNTAYNIPQKNTDTKRYDTQTRQYRRKNHAQPKRVKFQSISEEERIASLFQRQMARQRAGRIFGVACAITMIAAIFSGILIRNSRILEMNYANVKIQKEINTLETKTTQLKEELAKKTDLDVIRSLAVSTLGMQDPGQKQIVRVEIPVSDQMIVESSETADAGKEAELSNALTNIEGFFKTIR